MCSSDLEGLKISQEPGAFNKKGDLKYLIDTDDPINVLKGLAFGAYATNEGKDYINNDFKSTLTSSKVSILKDADLLSKENIAFVKGLPTTGIKKNEDDKSSIANSKSALIRESMISEGLWEEFKEYYDNATQEQKDKFNNNYVSDKVMLWTEREFNEYLEKLSPYRN